MADTQIACTVATNNHSQQHNITTTLCLFPPPREIDHSRQPPNPENKNCHFHTKTSAHVYVMLCMHTGQHPRV